MIYVSVSCGVATVNIDGVEGKGTVIQGDYQPDSHITPDQYIHVGERVYSVSIHKWPSGDDPDATEYASQEVILTEWEDWPTSPYAHTVLSVTTPIEQVQ